MSSTLMLLLFLPTSHGIEALAVLDRRLSIQRSNFNITRERINGESSYQITLRFSGFYFSPHCLPASLTPRFMSFSLLYVIGPLSYILRQIGLFVLPPTPPPSLSLGLSLIPLATLFIDLSPFPLRVCFSTFHPVFLLLMVSLPLRLS